MILDNHKEDLNTYAEGEEEIIKECLERARIRKRLEDMGL